MNKQERKAYMKQMAENARAQLHAMEMKRAAITAAAIRASVRQAKCTGEEAMSAEEFIARMDAFGTSDEKSSDNSK